MKIKEGFEIQSVCGEYIIVPAGVENVDYSRIISLNETAAYLWQNVADKPSFTIDDMTALLLAEYDVEENIAREDCALIIERWKETLKECSSSALTKEPVDEVVPLQAVVLCYLLHVDVLPALDYSLDNTSFGVILHRDTFIADGFLQFLYFLLLASVWYIYPLAER